MSSRRPRPARTAVVLIAAGTALAAPASLTAQKTPDTVPDPVYLRLSPGPERTLTYAHRVRARMDAPPELGGSRSLESAMRLRHTPVRIGADSVDLRIEVEEITLSADSIGEPQLPDLERHRGSTYLARMTTRGELVRMTEDDPRGDGRRAAGVSPVRRSVRMGGFPTLPEDPVRPGDSWVDTSRVDTGVMQGVMEGGETRAVSRTTLEELRRQGGTRVARLSVVTDYTFRPADSARSGVRASMSGSGSAAVRFDVTHGRYLQAEASQDYTVNLRFPDGSRTFSVRFQVDTEARLVEVGDAGEPDDAGADRSGPGGRR